MLKSNRGIKSKVDLDRFFCILLKDSNALKNFVFIKLKQLIASFFVSKDPILKKVSVLISPGSPRIISGGIVAVVVYA